MSRFKLIGIRPLKGCHARFRKNLKTTEAYKFNNEYDIKINKRGSLLHILPKESLIKNLFDITCLNNHSVNVNISAIVGQNGSGKSTLFELMYCMVFVVGTEEGILKPSLKEIEHRLKIKTILAEEKFYLQELKKELLFIFKNFKAELYFEREGYIYWLKFSNILTLKRIKISYTTKTLKEREPWKPVNNILESFFYTIGINYSLYGLNSNYVGSWIEKLFHKNDAYQTPIVINPMRDKGNIDINSEFHLGQSRILTNLTSIDIKYPEIINGKKISHVDFIIRPMELESLHGIAIQTIFIAFEKKHGFSVFDFFFRFLSKAVGLTFSMKEQNELKIRGRKDLSLKKSPGFQYTQRPKSINYKEIQYLLVKYCIRKTFKIVWQYDEYKNDFSDIYVRENTQGNDLTIPLIKNFPGLIKKLKDDPTHITHKLKQALFSLKEKYLHLKWSVERDIVTGYQYCFKTSIDYEILKSKINDVWAKNRRFPNGKIAMIPCAFARPSFVVADKDSLENSSFYFLSSGELQFAFSIHSVYYHILNLNSVRRNKKSRKKKYTHLNLLFDEVELCFHPEFQRNFIYEILNGLKQYKINSIESINMVFATHSPFILSDIPHTNISKLNNGKIVPFNQTQVTFGANIHDLLANDFFLSGGYMGKLAENKIRLITDSLSLYSLQKDLKNLSPITQTYKDKTLELTELKSVMTPLNEKEMKDYIDFIGEPLIRDSLNELYFSVFSNKIDKEIEKLELLKKLRS